MFWDITIAAGIALSQLFVTIYAVWVSVTENKLKTAAVIAIVGALGIALTIWGAIRSGTAQASLQTQLDKIQKNTETPPIVSVNPQITMPQTPAPREHTRVDWKKPAYVNAQPLLPYRKGEDPELNVGWMNGGDFQVREAHARVALFLSPTEHLDTLFRDNRAKLNGAIEAPLGAANPHTNDFNYATYTVGRTLTDDDVIKLTKFPGDLGLCAIGKIVWRDDSGHYETDLAGCLFSEPNNEFNWHFYGDHNVEHKLK